jgi:hypothetical protein
LSPDKPQGCTKQTSGTDAGYCAGKLFNMSAVYFKSNVTDDDVKVREWVTHRGRRLLVCAARGRMCIWRW